MAIVCPTVLAESKDDFATQIKRVSFAGRVQLDFMDGEFVETKSLELKEAWWPNVKADIHLMYKRPMDHLETILRMKPNLVIVHAEAEIHHMHFAAELHSEGILAGLCILPETPIGNVEQILSSFDHLLIFGGKLGYFGGQADLNQLSKAWEAKQHHPDIEIGWDGGVNDQNAKQLVDGGIDVLNVGGYIQKAEDPKASYQKIVDVISR
jgi:ribulose-phosphate 3-epimerase